MSFRKGKKMEQEEAQAVLEPEAKHLEGKYLTFVLCNEEYGLEILKVRDIMGLQDITPIPQTPDFIKGVINIRGKVIPVIDLRLKFNMPPVDYTKETCIVVVDVDSLLIGLIVDTVSEVVDIKEDDIEPPPSFGQKVDIGFILGMAKSKETVKILLHIDRVLSGEELSVVKGVAE